MAFEALTLGIEVFAIAIFVELQTVDCDGPIGAGACHVEQIGPQNILTRCPRRRRKYRGWNVMFLENGQRVHQIVAIPVVKGNGDGEAAVVIFARKRLIEGNHLKMLADKSHLRIELRGRDESGIDAPHGRGHDAMVDEHAQAWAVAEVSLACAEGEGCLHALPSQALFDFSPKHVANIDGRNSQPINSLQFPNLPPKLQSKTMKTILVVNGEDYWQAYLPHFKVHQKRLQTCEWILKNGQLHVIDAEGVVQPDAILWRVGAIKPSPKHEAALRLIHLSGIPCVNSAKVLLQGFDRLSMLSVLTACGLPVIPFQATTNTAQLHNIAHNFPFVVKAGNYHGGFGKVLVKDADQWQDVKDLLFMSEDYVTVEPYIRYERDIRYLAIGEQVWAMARRGKFWKANVETAHFTMIDTTPTLVAQTKQLQAHLGADVLAIDILEENDGTPYFVEYNDIPGISGFPTEAKWALVECVSKKM
jgi:ribosomal protein S6--L-glutamate ligase